jgi:hypothetical protein
VRPQIIQAESMATEGEKKQKKKTDHSSRIHGNRGGEKTEK